MKKPILLFAMALVALTVACSKLQESPEPAGSQQEPSTNTEDFISAYTSVDDFLAKENTVKQNFNGNAESAIMLTTQAGIEISISPMSLVDHAGNPITGSVQISIEEYSEYDAFHKDQITTETNNNVLLESAGMFNIEVKQAGSTLRLKDGSNYTVSFPTSDPSMKAYAGTQLPDGSVVWEEESNWLTGLDTARLRTLFSPDSFRFINCDKPIIVNDPVNHVIVLNQEDEGKDWLATLYLKERRTACRISKQTDGSISVNPNFQLPTGEKALITIMMVHNNLVYWYDTTITLGDSPSLTVPKLTPITKQEFTARAQYLKNF